MAPRVVGTLLIVGGLGTVAAGWRIARYFGAPKDPQVTSSFQSHHNFLTLFGQLLFIIGLAITMIGGMVGFG